MTAASLVIRPLAPERAGDFFAFFEGRAFSDNPRWSSCYCQCFLVDHRKVVWKERRGDENRAAAASSIERGAMQGFLAYHEGRPVGWCNAGPWRLMTALHEQEEPLAGILGEIVCFLVDPAFRRQGVATALLDAACDGLRAQGLTLVEAYAKADATSDAENHHGPLALYLAAGFEPHRSDNDGGVYVRKILAPPGADATLSADGVADD